MPPAKTVANTIRTLGGLRDADNEQDSSINDVDEPGVSHYSIRYQPPSGGGWQITGELEGLELDPERLDEPISKERVQQTAQEEQWAKGRYKLQPRDEKGFWMDNVWSFELKQGAEAPQPSSEERQAQTLEALYDKVDRLERNGVGPVENEGDVWLRIAEQALSGNPPGDEAFEALGTAMDRYDEARQRDAMRPSAPPEDIEEVTAQRANELFAKGETEEAIRVLEEHHRVKSAADGEATSLIEEAMDDDNLSFLSKLGLALFADERSANQVGENVHALFNGFLTAGQTASGLTPATNTDHTTGSHSHDPGLDFDRLYDSHERRRGSRTADRSKPGRDPVDPESANEPWEPSHDLPSVADLKAEQSADDEEPSVDGSTGDDEQNPAGTGGVASRGLRMQGDRFGDEDLVEAGDEMLDRIDELLQQSDDQSGTGEDHPPNENGETMAGASDPEAEDQDDEQHEAPCGELFDSAQAVNGHTAHCPECKTTQTEEDGPPRDGVAADSGGDH